MHRSSYIDLAMRVGHGQWLAGSAERLGSRAIRHWRGADLPPMPAAVDPTCRTKNTDNSPSLFSYLAAECYTQR